MRRCSSSPTTTITSRRCWRPCGRERRREPETSRHQAARLAREQLLDGDRTGDDALGQRVPDQLLDDLAVRRDAVGQGIAGDLHHPAMHLVYLGRLLDLARLEAVHVDALG